MPYENALDSAPMEVPQWGAVCGLRRSRRCDRARGENSRSAGPHTKGEINLDLRRASSFRYPQMRSGVLFSLRILTLIATPPH